MNENRLYHYKAIVRRVYDGDTITVDIDLGLKTIISEERLRLHRINAPEVRGLGKEAGFRSRDYLIERLNGKEVWIETIKDKKGKFGRYIAEVWLKDGDHFVNINDELVEKGLAEYKAY